jgi:DNA-binding response OmpR family regulator
MDLKATVDADGLRDSAMLLVEDDEADILLLRRAFRNARIANPLIEVRNGQAAIQYLSGDGAYADRVRYPIPFLILLDLRLPKLSGFEVLEWIRDQSEFDHVIVVVLTASDHVVDVTRAHELGANSYLIKPGNFDELVELVKGINGSWLVLPPPHEIRASMESPRAE